MVAQLTSVQGLAGINCINCLKEFSDSEKVIGHVNETSLEKIHPTHVSCQNLWIDSHAAIGQCVVCRGPYNGQVHLSKINFNDLGRLQQLRSLITSTTDNGLASKQLVIMIKQDRVDFDELKTLTNKTCTAEVIEAASQKIVSMIQLDQVSLPELKVLTQNRYPELIKEAACQQITHAIRSGRLDIDELRILENNSYPAKIVKAVQSFLEFNPSSY